MDDFIAAIVQLMDLLTCTKAKGIAYPGYLEIHPKRPSRQWKDCLEEIVTSQSFSDPLAVPVYPSVAHILRRQITKPQSPRLAVDTRRRTPTVTSCALDISAPGRPGGGHTTISPLLIP